MNPNVLRDKNKEINDSAEQEQKLIKFAYDLIIKDEVKIRRIFGMQDSSDKQLLEEVIKAIKDLDQRAIIPFGAGDIRFLKPGDEIQDPLAKLGLLHAVSPDHVAPTKYGTLGHKIVPTEEGIALIDELRESQGRPSVAEEQQKRWKGFHAIRNS